VIQAATNTDEASSASTASAKRCADGYDDSLLRHASGQLVRVRVGGGTQPQGVTADIDHLTVQEQEDADARQQRGDQVEPAMSVLDRHECKGPGQHEARGEDERSGAFLKDA
jgi:hypothetical protein